MKENQLVDIRDLVSVCNDEVFCDSRKVAEIFKKEHKNVLRDIRNLLANLEEVRKSHGSNLTTSDLQELNRFIKKIFISDRGKELPYYEMNRPAFSLLAMGFTGKKALVWKRQFNNAFYMMEQKLIENNKIEYSKPGIEQGLLIGRLKLKLAETNFNSKLSKIPKLKAEIKFEEAKLNLANLEAKAKKLIITKINPELLKAEKIVNWLIKKKKENFTKRDILRSLKQDFQKVKELDDPIEILIERNYIKKENKKARNGKTVIYFDVNLNFIMENQ